MTLTDAERKELEELREFKENWAKLTSTDYHSEDGKATLEIRGEFVKGMTILLVEWFLRDMEAENYTETKVYHPETGMMIMSVQRVDGKTPHDLRVEAEEKAQSLRKTCDLALAYIEDRTVLDDQGEPEFVQYDAVIRTLRSASELKEDQS